MRTLSPPQLWNDLLIALSLLTRLPVPEADWSSDGHAARAAWAYPVAGLIVALPSLLIVTLLHNMGCPAPVSALVFLATVTLASGAMHEDGLADCADGFWGGWDPVRRLEIMKDSAIGAYGVLALIFVTGIKWAALSALLTSALPIWQLLVPPLLSRTLMVGTMYALPHARADGLSAQTGRPDFTATAAAFGVASISCLIAPLQLWPVVVIGVLVAIGVAVLARRKIGGQTGDVLGATQSVSEAAMLATLATLAI